MATSANFGVMSPSVHDFVKYPVPGTDVASRAGTNRSFPTRNVVLHSVSSTSASPIISAKMASAVAFVFDQPCWCFCNNSHCFIRSSSCLLGEIMLKASIKMACRSMGA